MPVGIFSFTIAASEILSKCFTKARSELPCAAISTRLPARTCGARVVGLAARVLRCERGRRRVVAAAPDEDLLLAEPGRHFRLAEPLQRSVVALVEPPVLHL